MAYKRKEMLDRPCKRGMRILYRRNKTAKATLRQIGMVERAILMANNLPNNTTHILEKNELWRRTLSIRQNSSPASRFANLRSNKIFKP